MFVEKSKSKSKEAVEIIQVNEDDINKLPKKNFLFDWKIELSNTVLALRIIDSKEVIGLISFYVHYEELRIEIKTLELSVDNVGKGKKYSRIAGVLIAYVCRMSFQLGFYGFVSLVPKTRLIKHYIIRYGFEEYGRQLAVDFERSEFLIKKYLQ